MKQIISLTIAAVLLSALPVGHVYADHSHTGNIFSNQNIGRAVGTGLGAFLGSKVGNGRGNDAAIAAGAVGGFVLGGKVGRDWKSNKRNHYPAQKRQANTRKSYLEPVQQMPELEHIDATYYATRTSNVRGGPSTKYRIVEGLQQGENVRVLGRVVEKNWYMIAQNDIIQGFVHMSLLKPTEQRYSYN